MPPSAPPLLMLAVFGACSITALALPAAATAAAITNGGFETGDFTGWSLDSDGFEFEYPNPNGEDDFRIIGVPGNHQARVEIGYPTDFGLFANTLYQPLDLTADPGTDLVLSFDWEFEGADDPDAPDERFAVGFSDPSGGFFGADGEPGTLLDVLTYMDDGSFSSVLDASFNNALDWVLEFQINSDGLNSFGSYVLLDNIRLDARPASGAPAPGGLFLPSLVLVTVLTHRARRLRRG
jgi:hypothetical protein